MQIEDEVALGRQIADKIAKLIEEQGTNAGAVAKQAGLGVTSVRDILNGRARTPNVSTLVRIANVLHADPGDLISPYESDPSANALYFALTPQNQRLLRAIMRAMLEEQETASKEAQ